MQFTPEASPQLQVFICTRSKDKGDSCGPKGAADLRLNLKNWVREQGLQAKVQVTASLCLGHCENGITACIYPQNKWFLKVDAQKDEPQLQKEILQLISNPK